MILCSLSPKQAQCLVAGVSVIFCQYCSMWSTFSFVEHSRQLKGILSSFHFLNACEISTCVVTYCKLMQPNNNNNELYLHGHKRDLQHWKSILTITKSKLNNAQYQAFDNKLPRISKQDVTHCTNCKLR